MPADRFEPRNRRRTRPQHSRKRCASAAMASPIPKSAASSPFPKVPRATSCAPLERPWLSPPRRGTGRYKLGLKILSLGGDAQSNLDIADVAAAIHALARRTRAPDVAPRRPRARRGRLHRKSRSARFFKVNTWVGRRMYLHSTSVGKALLAWLPKQELEAIVRQQGMKANTENHHDSITPLADLEHVREQGYAVDDEENSLGARCLGAPFLTLREA